MDETFTPEKVTVKYRVAVAGAEPVRLHYGKIRFRPIRAEVTFVDGEPDHVQLIGSNVKADGSDGANVHEQGYSMSWTQREDGPPPWFGPLIEQLRPAARRASI